MVVFRQVKIITSYEGQFGPCYTAVTGNYKGPSDPMGRGLTEAEAVGDLFKCIWEREDEEAENTLKALIKRADAHFEE